MRISVVGMPWYRKADYARLRASFADGARLHQTYAEWCAAARATEAHLRCARPSSGSGRDRPRRIRRVVFRAQCRAGRRGENAVRKRIRLPGQALRRCTGGSLSASTTDDERRRAARHTGVHVSARRTFRFRGQWSSCAVGRTLLPGHGCARTRCMRAGLRSAGCRGSRTGARRRPPSSPDVRPERPGMMTFSISALCGCLISKWLELALTTSWIWRIPSMDHRPSRPT